MPPEKKAGKSEVIEVTLPYEKSTKNFWKFSTLESRDPEKAKEDPARVNSQYVKKPATANGRTPKSATIRTEVAFE